MSGKLTTDEIEYGGRPTAGKAWSEEARAAALATRRRNSQRSAAMSRSGNPTLKRAHELSGVAYDTTDKVNKNPTRDGHRIAAFGHSIAATAQEAHGNTQLAEDHRRLAAAHDAEAAKPRPGKVNRDKVRDTGSDDSTRGHDKPLAGTQFKPKPKKSFYATGDAVELTTKPGKRLLVIDAGIDEKAGPWVAVRDTRPGVAGADQKRFVVKPDELNTID